MLLKPLLLSCLCLGIFTTHTAVAESIKIDGKLNIDNRNISGLVITNDFMALATDEGNAIQILRKQGNKYIADSTGVIELSTSKDELDLEGLAWQAPYLYAIGSHSKKRKRVKSNASDEKNLKRLEPIIAEPSREQLFQVELSPTGDVKQIRSLSLSKWLQQNPILAPFLAIPSKENGIDIEGIAVNKNQLTIGFRGPVLRGNLATVMRFELDAKRFKLQRPELKMLNLGGFGIRDLAAQDDEILILAGPVNEVPNQYSLFRWNGENRFAELKAEFQIKDKIVKGKPEAIALDAKQRLWLGQDGLKDGAIERLEF